MRFKQFLTEVGGNFQYGGETRHGQWNLPTFNTQFLTARYYPAHGFQNFGQLTQWQQIQHRLTDRDYLNAMTLDRIANLAENATATILMNKQDVESGRIEASQLRMYQQGKVHPGGYVTGLTEEDIKGGEYPRIRPEDLHRALELGVITFDNKSGYFSININVLRESMRKMLTKLASKEHEYERERQIAGGADRLAQVASSGGQIPLSHSVNPFGNSGGGYAGH